MGTETAAFLALIATLFGIAYKVYSISKHSSEKDVSLEKRLSNIERKLDLNDAKDVTLLEKLDELKDDLKDSRLDSKLIEKRLTTIETCVTVLKH